MNISIFNDQYNSLSDIDKMQNKNVPHFDKIQAPIANVLEVKRILDDKRINRENLDQFKMARNQLNRVFCSPVNETKLALLNSKAWSLIFPLLTDIGNRLGV